jgi:hypothetical protein
MKPTVELLNELRELADPHSKHIDLGFVPIGKAGEWLRKLWAEARLEPLEVLRALWESLNHINGNEGHCCVCGANDVDCGPTCAMERTKALLSGAPEAEPLVEVAADIADAIPDYDAELAGLALAAQRSLERLIELAARPQPTAGDLAALKANITQRLMAADILDKKILKVLDAAFASLILTGPQPTAEQTRSDEPEYTSTTATTCPLCRRPCWAPAGATPQQVAEAVREHLRMKVHNYYAPRPATMSATQDHYQCGVGDALRTIVSCDLAPILEKLGAKNA